jgi:TonB family protein
MNRAISVHAIALLSLPLLAATGAWADAAKADSREMSPADLEESCRNDQAADCMRLGHMYEGGRGVDKDESKAATLFTKACEGRVNGGCLHLGDLYLAGRGVEKDERNAVRFYEMSCEQGYPAPCASLGVRYLQGLQVEKDENRAAELFDLACAGGEPQGCSLLFTMGGRGSATRPRYEMLAEMVRGRAESDLECAELEVTPVPGPGSVIQAKGCKRQALYTWSNKGVVQQPSVEALAEMVRRQAKSDLECPALGITTIPRGGMLIEARGCERQALYVSSSDQVDLIRPRTRLSLRKEPGFVPPRDEITPPKLLRGRDPVYTKRAIAARVRGLLMVKCTISTTGRLEDCRIIKSIPYMNSEVLEALATREYEPVTFNGKPVAVDYVFNINLIAR